MICGRTTKRVKPSAEVKRNVRTINLGRIPKGRLENTTGNLDREDNEDGKVNSDVDTSIEVES